MASEPVHRGRPRECLACAPDVLRIVVTRLASMVRRSVWRALPLFVGQVEAPPFRAVSLYPQSESHESVEPVMPSWGVEELPPGSLQQAPAILER